MRLKRWMNESSFRWYIARTTHTLIVLTFNIIIFIICWNSTTNTVLNIPYNTVFNIRYNTVFSTSHIHHNIIPSYLRGWRYVNAIIVLALRLHIIIYAQRPSWSCTVARYCIQARQLYLSNAGKIGHEKKNNVHFGNCYCQGGIMFFFATTHTII